MGKRIVRALLTVTLAGSVVSGVSVSGSSAARAAPAGSDKNSRQVTLITGDRLTVAANGEVVVQPDAARQGIRYSAHTSNGQKYVIPSDALPALTAGDLDYQLFNVTELVNSGYTTGRLPLIVSYASGGESATRNVLSSDGATVTRRLASVHSLAATADVSALARLWADLTTASSQGRQGRQVKSDVDKIWLDRVQHTTLDQSVPQIGAPAAWAAGYDGTGTTVAVLDTGIDTNHPDLAGGKVIAAQNFTDDPDTDDHVGHGTHVASTVAGTGAASQGRYRGVAPGAKLLNGKVCTDSGCTTSSVIAGMEWAAAQGADVVNMSLGGQDADGIDPLEQAVNDLSATTHTLFVVAAGNVGQTSGLASPGTADAALTVGAVDGSDNLADFSQRGPRPDDAGLKPDLTAPGVNITAAEAGTTGYIDHSGTSMATPHVAGAAAILHQRRPTWTAAQLKSVLVGSAAPNASLGAYEQGSGRVDVARAYQQTILAEPASISLGRQAYPHGDDPVLTRTVTYRNYGTAAVTLALALSTRGPSGSPAPAGMFALSAASVTVPAGGSASVTLTADTRVDTPDGYYTGAIVATATGVTVRTAFAVDRAIEQYDLTVDHISRQGTPTAAYFCLVQSADGRRFWLLGGPGPVRIPRLPRGTYLVTSMVYDFGPQGSETSVLVAPRLELTGDTSLVMDARLAKPVSIAVPDPQVAVQSYLFGDQLTGYGEGAWWSGYTPGSGTAYTAQIGPDYAWGSVSEVSATLAVPGADNDFFNSPRVYNLAWFTEQRMPTGFTHSVAPADLATVETTTLGTVPGWIATKAGFPHPGGTLSGSGILSAVGRGLDFALPAQRTEFYNTDNGVRWHSVLAERPSVNDPPSNQLVSPVTHYPGNTTVRETWNSPVYGPAFTSSVYPQNWVVRRGDTITVDLPLTSDGDGHAGLPHPAFVSGDVVLKRNGTTIGRAQFPTYQAPPSFAVPSGNAQYRLEADVTRSAPVALSTRITAAWTFNSDSVDPNSYLRLPLWAVTFAPATDLYGTAPSGRSFPIPLRAQVQPGSASSSLRSLTVDYSLDDGGTWQSAAVTTAADGTGTATVTHPSGTGFVSLRARADDWAGNVVEETMLRAYRIG